jgi:hypothetical protein
MRRTQKPQAGLVAGRSYCCPEAPPTCDKLPRPIGPSGRKPTDPIPDEDLVHLADAPGLDVEEGRQLLRDDGFNLSRAGWVPRQH